MTQLTSDLIHGFSGAVLAHKYDGATPTPKFHMELWDLFCKPNKFIAAAAPRGHGKSTAITLAYILAHVLFRARRFVLIVSDTESQAVNFLGDIKNELKNNEDLNQLFQVKGFPKDTGSDIIVEMEDGYTFRIIAKGAEQRVRGLKWDSLRPDLIVCDDLESDEQVYNKDRREKFKRWFYGALIPSMSNTGILRVVGTILHLDSLLNNLMPDESLKSTTFEPLRTYNFITRSEWKSVRYRAHNEDYTELLWPTRFSKDFYEKLREDFNNKGLSDVYSQEYLNYPIDESVSYFKRQDFIAQTEVDKLKSKRYYAAADFAVSTASRADYTAIVIAGMDEDGILHIEHVVRERMDSLEIVEELFALERMFQPEAWIMEKGTIEKSLGPILRAEMLKRGVYLNLHTVTAAKDKQTRARSLQARLRAGGLRVDKEASWYMHFEDEFARFPKSRHDDQVDALAWLGLEIDKLQNAMTADEEEEEEYRMFLQESGYDQQGRNTFTGY